MRTSIKNEMFLALRLIYANSVSVSGINSRMGAQILVQSSVFKNSPVAITSRDSDETGYVLLSQCFIP
jgi:hypothetical protein